MITPIKHLAVNWVDGMKLSRSHFIDADLHHIDTLRDITALSITPYNYGLLPAGERQSNSLDMQILEKVANHIEVSVAYCNAVTASGGRINFSSHQYGGALQLGHYFNPTENDSLTVYGVFLRTNPFDRVPIGMPDPEEEPIRYPYLQNCYSLAILPLNQVGPQHTADFHLLLAKLTVENGEIKIQKDYIPSCSTVGSHSQLLKYYQLFDELISELQRSSFKIIDRTGEDNVSVLGRNVRVLAEKLLTYIASTLFDFHHQMVFAPPINLIGYIATLAHHFYTAVQLIQSKEREEMLQYFYEWQDINPGSFNELIVSVINVNYNHDDCLPSFQVASDFLNILSTLWGRLSSLEFIGQRKENIVVAEQRIVSTTVQSKRTWSILD